MKPPSPKILRIIVYLVLLPIIVGAFNIVINPFDQWNIPRIAGLNDKITEGRWDTYIKSYQIKHNHYDTLILGSSRAAIALSPHHAAFQQQSTYNYGLSGAGIHLQHLALQHALATHSINTAIITPDFFGFNVYMKLNQPAVNGHPEIETLFNPSLQQNIRDSFSNTLNWKAINSSLRTLISQNQKTVYIDQQGFWNRFGTKDRDYEEQYNRTEKIFLTELLYPAPQKQFSFHDDISGYDSFSSFQSMLALVYEKNINVKIIILPTPPRDLLALQSLGLWDDYNTWKRKLTYINEEVAAHFNQSPIEIWDFENVYPKSHPDNVIDQKIYFYEPFHPTRLTGGEILNRVFLDCLTVTCWPGSVINSHNVDQSLSRLELELERYKNNHPLQMAALQKNINKTRNYRQNDAVSPR